MTNLEVLAKKARSDNERLNMFMDGIEEFISTLSGREKGSLCPYSALDETGSPQLLRRNEMVNMKTDKCPQCGGVVFKLTGKASKLCHDLCLKCRTKQDDTQHNEE